MSDRPCRQASELVLNVQITDTRRAAWCPECLLPSALDVDADVTRASSGKRFGTLQMVVCPDCGHAAPRGDGAGQR